MLNGTSPIMYQHSAPMIKNFIKGAGKAVIYTIGVLTELIGREEYGNKIQNPSPSIDFPLIQNKSYKEIGEEVISSPVILLAAIKYDPTNAELWGEAAAMIGAVNFDLGMIGKAPDISLGLNEVLPSGPPRSLIRFADQQSAAMHYDWSRTLGNFADPRATDNSFADIFTRVMDHVTNYKGTVKFDLTNVDMGSVASDIGKSLSESSSITILN